MSRPDQSAGVGVMFQLTVTRAALTAAGGQTAGEQDGGHATGDSFRSQAQVHVGGSCLFGGREHVEVHRHDHRDEHDGVVEQVQLDARHPELHEAGRHRPIEQVLPEQILGLQQQVLDVMEELDRERDRPPAPILDAAESRPAASTALPASPPHSRSASAPTRRGTGRSTRAGRALQGRASPARRSGRPATGARPSAPAR